MNERQHADRATGGISRLSRHPLPAKYLLHTAALSLLTFASLNCAADTYAVPPHVSGGISAEQLSPDGDGSLDLNALKGHVAYVDFWASWCGPCRKSFPWMIDMQSRFAKRGLVIVAIDVDKDRALSDQFLQEFRPPFPVLYDPRGVLAQKFDITGMPSSIILDKQGKIRFTHTGFRSDQAPLIENELQSLL